MNMEWQSAGFMVFFVESMILFKYLNGQFTAKYHHNFNLLYVLLITVMGFFLRQFAIIGMILSYLGIFILINFIYFNTIQQKVVALGTFMLLNIAIENVAVLLFVAIFDVNMTEITQVSLISIGAIVISKMLLFLIITYLVHRKTKKLLSLRVQISKLASAKIVLFLILINFLLILIIDIYTTIPLQTNIRLYLLILTNVSICVLSVHIYELLIKASEAQIELKLLLQKKEAEQKYNQELGVAVDSIRAIKHDMSNHLSVISACIDCEDYEKAKHYIHKITEPINSVNYLLNIDHSVIASILYVKNMLAKKKEIAFDTEIDIYDNVLIDDVDLTILLGNILDNSIEACEKIANEEKKISLYIESEKDFFFLDCTNTIDQEKVQYKDKKLSTTKKDRSNHGFGLKNIQAVVDKYEGSKNIVITEEDFTIEIVLKNIKKS